MTADDDALIQKNTRILQIIAAALILGIVSFLGLVLFLRGTQQNAPAQEGQTLLSLMAAVMLLVNAPLAVFLPRTIAANAVRRIGPGNVGTSANVPFGADPNPACLSTLFKLLAIRQTSTIIGLALLEGAGFFGTLAYLLEGQMLALAVVAAVLLLMILSFPTEGRVRAWLQRQEDFLQENEPR